MSGIHILHVLYAFFLIIIALIVLVLIVPSELSFLLATEGLSLETELNFSILSGFLGGSMTSDPEGSSFELLLFARAPIMKRKQKKEWERKAKPRQGRAPLESIGLFKKLYDPFIGLLRAFLRHTLIRKLDCRIDVGLPDPVHTGMIYGTVYPIWEMIRPFISNASFIMTPVFTEELFNASLRGNISLRIAYIIVPLLRLFSKKEVRMLRRSSKRR